MVFSNQRRSLIVLLSSNLFWQSLVCLLTWKLHWLKFKIRVWIPMSTIQMTPVYQVWPLMTTQLDKINQPMKSMNKEMSIVSFLVTVLQQTDSRHDSWQPSIKKMSQKQTQSLSPCLYPRAYTPSETKHIKSIQDKYSHFKRMWIKKPVSNPFLTSPFQVNYSNI